MDGLKRAIARTAFQPFFDRLSISPADGPTIHDYEVTVLSDLLIRVRIHGKPNVGPRYFEVKVKEDL